MLFVGELGQQLLFAQLEIQQPRPRVVGNSVLLGFGIDEDLARHDLHLFVYPVEPIARLGDLILRLLQHPIDLGALPEQKRQLLGEGQRPMSRPELREPALRRCQTLIDRCNLPFEEGRLGCVVDRDALLWKALIIS
ncbi:MAG: hypothetical protein WDO24_14800 [Pseudomonadota bacterium]